MESSPSLGQGSRHLHVAPTAGDIYGRRRRTQSQRGRGAECLSLPSPSSSQDPGLTSLWFSSLRMAQCCRSSLRALSSSRLGLFPKPMLSWYGKGRAQGLRNPRDQVSALPPWPQQTWRQEGSPPHPRLSESAQEAQEKGLSSHPCPHLAPPTLSGSPQFFPSLLISSWKCQPKFPCPPLQAPWFLGPLPQSPTPSTSHPPQTLCSLAEPLP